MKKNKSLREVLISVLTVTIAGIALFISIKSCNQSEEALQLQRKEFESSRSAVWSLKITENNEAYLESVSDEIKLQKAFIYFPPRFGISAKPVKSPDYILNKEFTENFLQIGISEIESPIIKKRILGIVSAIPVVIESWYVAKGNSYQDLSLYSLEFSPKPINKDTVNISGLSFAKRLKSDVNVRTLLREEWEKYQNL